MNNKDGVRNKSEKIYNWIGDIAILLTGYFIFKRLVNRVIDSDFGFNFYLFLIVSVFILFYVVLRIIKLFRKRND